MDLYALQEKIRKGYEISPAEQAFMMKSTDDQGRVSRRQFIGWRESPDSVIDFDD